MDERGIVRAVALGRVAVGVAALAAPEPAMRLFVGRDARRPAVQLVTRGLGVRDLALGAGALVALQTGEPARRWILAGAAADAGDAFASLAGDALPGPLRAGFASFAGGAALLGLALARRLA